MLCWRCRLCLTRPLRTLGAPLAPSLTEHLQARWSFGCRKKPGWPSLLHLCLLILSPDHHVSLCSPSSWLSWTPVHNNSSSFENPIVHDATCDHYIWTYTHRLPIFFVTLWHILHDMVHSFTSSLKLVAFIWFFFFFVFLSKHIILLTVRIWSCSTCIISVLYRIRQQSSTIVWRTNEWLWSTDFCMNEL